MNNVSKLISTKYALAVLMLAVATLETSAQPSSDPGIIGESGVAGERPAGSTDGSPNVRPENPTIPAATGIVPKPFDPDSVETPEGKRAKQRDALAKQVYKGEKRSLDAVLELDSTDVANQDSAASRLAYGQEALEIGMRLADARRSDDAAEFFKAAEKSLRKAAKSFGKDDPVGEAEALYALAHLQANFLGQKVRAYQTLAAALQAQPNHPGALSAKAQLETQYPAIQKAPEPSDGL